MSDGGLALAAFEMAEASALGVSIEVSGIAALFGEDQGRYLLAVAPEDADALKTAAASAGVPLHVVGAFTGTQVRFGSDRADLAELSKIYRSSFANAVS